MNTKLRSIIESAAATLRGQYARDVLSGRQAWSGADLQGKAREYYSSYARQRVKAAAALRNAGGTILRCEHNRLATAVLVCVDDYGNQVYATFGSYVRPASRHQCREI